MLAMFDQALALPAESVLRMAKQVGPLGSCASRARSGVPAGDGVGAVTLGAVVTSSGHGAARRSYVAALPLGDRKSVV